MPASSVLSRAGLPDLAYHMLDGDSPTVVFMGGFMSDMAGTKALALEDHCRDKGRAYVRFDYRGHGESEGNFSDGTIGGWTTDALDIIDHETDGPLILIGSSMGGWIALLSALARPDRVAGLIGLAAAPDFTEDLLWAGFPDDVQREIMEKGVYHQPSEYGAPYPITKTLIEEGRDHLLLRDQISLHCPVRLLQGLKDDDVPYSTAMRLMDRLESDDVIVTLLKRGDHRLSEPADLDRLTLTLEELCRRVEETAQTGETSV